MSNGSRDGSGCCHRRRMRKRRTTTSSRCSSPTRCTRRTSTSSATAGSCARRESRITLAARCATAADSSTRRRPDRPRRSRSADSRVYPPAMLTGGWRGGSGAPRILLVDDDPNLLVLLADQLRADGFEIQTARDGEEALRRLDGGWPDLLVVDMMMARMDGLTLAREVKARADLPIIVLSAIDTADSKADLLEEVAEDYVTKPYHYPELRARVTRVLRRLGDRVPRQRLDLGPNLALELHRREAIVGGETVSLTPTES